MGDCLFPKKYETLAIGRIGSFSRALLRKQWWGFAVDGNGPWRRVIVD